MTIADFSLCRTPLDAASLARALGDGACGALVTFEGWVRNHHDGRDVLRLEYEAYDALAGREGKRILDEAARRFDVVGVRCAHRLGPLAIGEMAVWVGVTAHHRDAAFAACRWVIDEVKQRVPIWKKEFYAGGDAVWVNCGTRPGASLRPAGA